MILSTEAIQDLENILRIEFGNEQFSKFSKTDVQDVGELLLFLTAESLKIQISAK